MSWLIPFRSSGFPPLVQSALPPIFAVDEFDLFWSAVTVGRPNIAAVLAHGTHSLAEAVWRSVTLDANIVQDPFLSGLHNSAAFNALDPTEKGWLNFLFGMLFTKLAADQLLGMHWLIHFKWFRSHHPVTMVPGGSTPDFVGYNPLMARYSVLEAKGRNAGYSSDVLDSAKQQARQPVRVNGQQPAMCIGSLLYRKYGERLAIAMVDPEQRDGRPIELYDTRETWAQYYSVAWGLSGGSDLIRPGLKEMTGFTVDFDEAVLPFVAEFFNAESTEWRAARDALFKWSSERSFARRALRADRGYRTFGDGIRIGIAPDRAGSLFRFADTL